MTTEPASGDDRPVDSPAESPAAAGERTEAHAETADATAAAAAQTPTEGGLRRWLPRRRSAPQEAQATADHPEDAPAEPAVGDEDGAGDRDAHAPARSSFFRRRAPADPAGGPAEAGTDGEPAGDQEAEAPDDERERALRGGPGRLRRRRKRLLREREQAVFHLGGLAYELHGRDLLDQEVLRRRAEQIGEIDDTVHAIDGRLAELAAARHQRRNGGEGAATVGNCLPCRAPFYAEAQFCWRCGSRLAPGEAEQVTEMIEAPQR